MIRNIHCLERCSNPSHTDRNSVAYCLRCEAYFCSDCEERFHGSIYSDHSRYVSRDMPEINVTQKTEEDASGKKGRITLKWENAKGEKDEGCCYEVEMKNAEDEDAEYASVYKGKINEFTIENVDLTAKHSFCIKVGTTENRLFTWSDEETSK